MKLMKTLLKVLSIAIILLAFVSCNLTKAIPSTSQKTIVKDSITTERKTIDTLVIARAADTVKLKATIDKLTKDAIVKRSNHARLSLRRVGNTIEAECHTDELKELIELQKEIINHYKEISTEKQETIIIPKKHIPELLKPLIWIGGIALVLIIGRIVLKFIKPKFL